MNLFNISTSNDESSENNNSCFKGTRFADLNRENVPPAIRNLAKWVEYYGIIGQEEYDKKLF
jgi:hypothetical protein